MRRDKMYKSNLVLISLITGEKFPIYYNRGYYMVAIKRDDYVRLDRLLRYDFTIREL